MLKKAVCSALIVMSAVAMADQDKAATPTLKQESAASSFKALDTNKDGVIDQNEANADKDLARVFPTVAKHGKLRLKAYSTWKANEMKKPGIAS